MRRQIGGFLTGIGGTALTFWFERQSLSGVILVLTAAISWTAAALLIWWPRWQAAGRAFLQGHEGHQAGRPNSRPSGYPADLRLLESVEQDTVLVSVSNSGATDSFAAQINGVMNAAEPTLPLSVRWRGTRSGTQEIVAGQTQFMEVLRVSVEQNPEIGAFSVQAMELLTPAGEVSLAPEWMVPGCITQVVQLDLTIGSTTTPTRYAVYQLFLRARNKTRIMAA